MEVEESLHEEFMERSNTLDFGTQEKVYFIAGSEWRDKEGRIVVIVRAFKFIKKVRH